MADQKISHTDIALICPYPALSDEIAGLLRSTGLSATLFDDAVSALESLTRHPPRLIIASLQMPGIDGWRLARLLRAPEYKVLNQVPILMIAEAYARDEAATIAGDLDVEAFLTWPEDRDQIQETAQALLRNESVRPRLRALVVEDDPGMARLIRRSLTDHQYEVTLVQRAEDAVKAAREHAFDIAVIDYHLPDRRGDTLLEEIGHLHPDCACIMITGDVAQKLAVDWMRRGAAAYLHKPFPMDYLVEICARARRERALLRAEGLLRKRSRTLVGLVEDQKLAQKALDWERDLLRVVIDHLPDGICLKDPQLCIRLINKAQMAALGIDAQDRAIGKTDVDFFPPDTAALFMATDRAVIEKGRSLLEREEILPRTDGSLREILTSRIPLLDEQGTVAGLVVIQRDITEHKDLEHQFRQAQKMESIGRLAGGIAHDFNNMLQSIFGNADLALQDAEPGSTLREDVLEIRNAARRSAELTGKLLAFARRQSISPETLDLNEAVGGTLPILSRMIGEQIELKWSPGPSPWPVRMDPSQLDQVLTNLAVNARDAISGSGMLAMETQNFTADKTFCESHIEARPGDYIRLTVSDTGSGMTREVQSHIFEPFFTTKEKGKGTGLGLSTVYGIIRQNGGFLYVYSEPGIGTTMQLFFPRAEEKSEDKYEVDEAEPAGGSETLLVVEDEAAILKLTQRILESFGYTILTAVSPEKALALAQQDTRHIDLLLTDVIMPGMNGRELAEQIKALRPNLPVVYMSGYTSDILDKEAALGKNVPFLAKPFTSRALAARVRHTLDARNAGKTSR